VECRCDKIISSVTAFVDLHRGVTELSMGSGRFLAYCYSSAEEPERGRTLPISLFGSMFFLKLSIDPLVTNKTRIWGGSVLLRRQSTRARALRGITS